MSPKDASDELCTAIEESADRPMDDTGTAFVLAWCQARAVKLASEIGERALPHLLDFIRTKNVGVMLTSTCEVFPETSSVVNAATAEALAAKLKESGTVLCPPDGDA